MADLSRMKYLIGKSWNSWNLPEGAQEFDLKKMRSLFKPKETKIPLERTNPLPNRLMYLFGSRPDFDWFSLTQCPACRKFYKTQWLNNHFIKNTAGEQLCKTTGIVVGTSQVKKKNLPKRIDSKHNHRYRDSRDYYGRRSKTSHHHSSSKSKRPSLVYVSGKSHRDSLTSFSNIKLKNKSKSSDDSKRRSKDKISTSSSKRHSSPKDRKLSNPTSYTLSIPDDRDENLPVKVLLSNKKSSKHYEKPSLEIISEKISKPSKISIEGEKVKIYKDSSDKKSRSGSVHVNSSHKHKRSTDHVDNIEHDLAHSKSHSYKDEYKFKIPLKSKSSVSNVQSLLYESSKISSSESTKKHKIHITSEISKTNDEAKVSQKVANRSQQMHLYSSLTNKPSSSTVSSLKISLQNISPTIKNQSGTDSAVTNKGISSKSHSKEKTSSMSSQSSKHTSSLKSTTMTKSTSPSSNVKVTTFATNDKQPVSISNAKSNLTVFNSKLSPSALDFKTQSVSKSVPIVSLKQPVPVSTNKSSSSSKNSSSLSRPSSHKSSSSSSSSSKSLQSKPSTVSSSKVVPKGPLSVSPKISSSTVSKSPSPSSGKLASSPVISKSSVVTTVKLPAPATSSSKLSPSSTKSHSATSKSSKSHYSSSIKSPTISSSGTSPSIKSFSSKSYSSSVDSLTSPESESSYTIKSEPLKVSSSALSSKSYVDSSGKHSSSSKEKKSSKSSSSSTSESANSKSSSAVKDKKHSSKHGSSSYSISSLESKSLVADKLSSSASSKEKKSSSKSSVSGTTTSDSKTSKGTAPVATKKSTVTPIHSPSSYKSLSPPYSSTLSVSLPPTYLPIAPSWTTAFKSSLAQTLSNATPKSSSYTTSANGALKTSSGITLHKGATIATTSAAMQPTIVASNANIISAPSLRDHSLLNQVNQYASTPQYIQAAEILRLAEAAAQKEKEEKAAEQAKPSHHKKKKKKKDKDKDETRKVIPLKDRCFHPDQHCGVVAAPSIMPCKRSLTCKTHSIALRRAVADRSSSFDSLLAAHKKARDEEKQTKTEKKENISTPEEPVEVVVPPPVAALPPPTPPVPEVSIVTVTVVKPEPVKSIPSVVIPKEVPKEIVPPVEKPEPAVSEKKKEEVVEATPSDIQLVKEVFRVVVVDPEQCKEGRSLYDISKDHEDPILNTVFKTSNCLNTTQFNRKFPRTKRPMDKNEEDDCVFLYSQKVPRVVEVEGNNQEKFQFVELSAEDGAERQKIISYMSKKRKCKSSKAPCTSTQTDPQVPGKSVFKTMNSLRARHAARRIAVLNQTLYAENSVTHKMNLVARHAQMARIALSSNNIEKARRHLAVKTIMMTQNRLSFSMQRCAKRLMKRRRSFSHKRHFLPNTHQLVEKHQLDRKQFLSKQYILIRRQLQSRERMKARKRVRKFYWQSIKRNMMTDKKKLGVQRKRIADRRKELDKHFRLNVFRNLRRIRKNVFNRRGWSVSSEVFRNARKRQHQRLVTMIKKRRLISAHRRSLLAQKQTVSRQLFHKQPPVKSSLVRQNYIKRINKSKILGIEKRRINSKSPTRLLKAQQLQRLGNYKACSTTVFMPLSKNSISLLVNPPTSKSKNKLDLGLASHVHNAYFNSPVKPLRGSFNNNFVGSQVVNVKKRSASVALVKKAIVAARKNKMPPEVQLGENFVDGSAATVHNMLSHHRSSLSQLLSFRKNSVLFARGSLNTKQLASKPTKVKISAKLPQNKILKSQVSAKTNPQQKTVHEIGKNSMTGLTVKVGSVKNISNFTQGKRSVPKKSTIVNKKPVSARNDNVRKEQLVGKGLSTTNVTQPVACKYRVVRSRTKFHENAPILDKNAKNSEGSKNAKVASVKKSSGSVIGAQNSRITGSGNTDTKELKTNIVSQSRLQHFQNSRVGKEVNVYYNKHGSTTQGSSTIDSFIPHFVSDTAKDPKKFLVPRVENLDKRKYMASLLAVKRLIEQKRISGQKVFTEQENNLLKLYLKYQSNYTKSSLIAKCVVTKSTRGQNELLNKGAPTLK